MFCVMDSKATSLPDFLRVSMGRPEDTSINRGGRRHMRGISEKGKSGGKKVAQELGRTLVMLAARWMMPNLAEPQRLGTLPK